MGSSKKCIDYGGSAREPFQGASRRVPFPDCERFFFFTSPASAGGMSRMRGRQYRFSQILARVAWGPVSTRLTLVLPYERRPVKATLNGQGVPFFVRLGSLKRGLRFPTPPDGCCRVFRGLQDNVSLMDMVQEFILSRPLEIASRRLRTNV